MIVYLDWMADHPAATLIFDFFFTFALIVVCATIIRVFGKGPPK